MPCSGSNYPQLAGCRNNGIMEWSTLAATRSLACYGISSPPNCLLSLSDDVACLFALLNMQIVIIIIIIIHIVSLLYALVSLFLPALCFIVFCWKIGASNSVARSNKLAQASRSSSSSRSYNLASLQRQLADHNNNNKRKNLNKPANR